MQWRRLLCGSLVSGRGAAVAVSWSLREARPSRPPTWAPASPRRISTPSSPLRRGGESLPQPRCSASQGCDGHTAPGSNSVLHGGTVASDAVHLARSSRTFASGVHQDGADVSWQPPPRSYAFVNDSRGAVDTTHSPDGRVGPYPLLKGDPTVSPSTAAANRASSAPRSAFVSVEGEAETVAAPIGPVRRALKSRQRHGGDENQGSFDMAASFLRPGATLTTNAGTTNNILAAAASGSYDAVGGPAALRGGTGFFNSAERQAHRLRRHKTRLSREQRRQERVQQQSGAALHPCRLQGGCATHFLRSPASLSRSTSRPFLHRSVCPLRHFPSHFCVTQLREGFCPLHEVGCCPWTHGDVGMSLSSSSFRALDVTVAGAESGDSVRCAMECSSLLPIESAQSKAALSLSSERLGRVLRLFVDAVVTVMMDTTEQLRARFVAGADEADMAVHITAQLLSDRWEALSAALNSVSCTQRHPRDTHNFRGVQQVVPSVGEVVVDLRAETLMPSIGGGDPLKWWALSVPADLAWCALDALDEGDNGTVRGQPLSPQEGAYWSSYVTLAEPGARAVLHEIQPGSRDSSFQEGAEEEVCRVRLTPCVSAWVVATAAAQLRLDSGAPTTRRAGEPLSHSAPLPPVSAKECFAAAASFVLGWRWAELQKAVTRSAAGEGELTRDAAVLHRKVYASTKVPYSGALTAAVTRAGAAVAGRRGGDDDDARSSVLKWAPLLFLKDATTSAHIVVKYGEGMGGEEDEAALGELAGSRGADGAHCTLLDFFLPLIGAGGDSRLLWNSPWTASVRSGMWMCAATLGPSFALPMPTSPPLQPPYLAFSFPSSPPHSLTAFLASFHAAWEALHTEVVVPLAMGLLRDGSTEQGASAGEVDTANGTYSLCLFTQPALLHVVSTLSAAFARNYEEFLRRSSGWQPWSDAQLFHREHAAVYNAGAYARHYFPVVRLGVLNSLLNALLLLTTSHVDRASRLHEPSDTHRVLFSSPSGAPRTLPYDLSPATDALSTISWLAAERRGEPRHRRSYLQSALSLSMGFLTALQDLSREQQQTCQSLMREYEQRRVAYHSSVDSRVKGDGGAASLHQQQLSSPSSSSPSFEAGGLGWRGEGHAALAGGPLLDRLLPFGTATVSPQATASLLRQLLEGGHPYKALKLAASIVHASRMLRHAGRQPRPSLQKSFKMVHTRVWSRRLHRQVLVKKRVPVMRVVGIVDAEQPEDEASRPGAAARRSVRPVGLAFILSDRLVVEMVRVGLRMGEAGKALVTGVLCDCENGALFDFTPGRGLPVPSWQVLEGAATRCRAGASRGTGELATTVQNCDTAAPTRGRQRGGGGSRDHEDAGMSLLTILGVDSTPTRGQVRSGSRSGGTDGVEWGVPPQRVAPTAALLEVLQSHTPPSDTAAHTHYLRLFLSDIDRFTSPSVLFALLYQACYDRSRYATKQLSGSMAAAESMHVAYVLSLSRGRTVPSRSHVDGSPTTASTDASMVVHRLLAELRTAAASELPAVRSTIASDASSLGGVQRGGTPSNSLTAAAHAHSVDDVKALLSSGCPGDSDRPHPSAKTRRTDVDVAMSPTRRARVSLRVLLHHIWTHTLLIRSATQQSRGLWAVCAATLLGLSPSTLSRSASAATTDMAGGAAFALHHAYVAAGLLLREAAPWTSQQYVDATVKALLLSRVFADAHEDTVPASVDGDATWPLLLSSAYAPAVRSLKVFLSLQCALGAELLSTSMATPITCGTGTTVVAEELQRPPMLVAIDSLVQALRAVSVHASRPASSLLAWQLFLPLLHQRELAVQWLQDTLLHPSSRLLLWFVTVVGRNHDEEELLLLLTWIRHVPVGPHLDLLTQQALVTELEHRYRRACARRTPSSTKAKQMSAAMEIDSTRNIL